MIFKKPNKFPWQFGKHSFSYHRREPLQQVLFNIRVHVYFAYGQTF